MIFVGPLGRDFGDSRVVSGAKVICSCFRLSRTVVPPSTPMSITAAPKMIGTSAGDDAAIEKLLVVPSLSFFFLSP